MHELKTIKISELHTDNETKTLVMGLLSANYDVYFSLITENYTTKEKKLSTWFHYGKNGFFAYYGTSASFDWLKETSTDHKPNRKTGKGYQIFEKEHITLDDLIFTFNKSCDNIFKGREQKHDVIKDLLQFWDVVQVVKG